MTRGLDVSYYVSITFLLLGALGLAAIKPFQQTLFRGSEETEVLAIVDDVSGTTERRPYDMVAWLGIGREELVRSGDYVRTNAHSQLELRVNNEKSTILIEENTLVRIFRDESNIRIVLSMGELKSDLDEATRVKIFKEDTEVTEGVRRRPSVKVTKVDSAGKSERTHSATADAERGADTRFRQYPPNGSVIFHSASTKQLVLHLKSGCNDLCDVQLQINGIDLSPQSWSQLGQGRVGLSIDDSMNGLVQWTASDSAGAVSGEFKLIPYSEAAVVNALAAGINFEILK